MFKSRLSEIGWYSDKKEVLEKEFKNFTDNVLKKDIPDIKALILPHAGYFYSAQTAFYALKEIEGKSYKRVVIIGPSHHIYMHDHVSVSNHSSYLTPLGEVFLDTDFISQLKKNQKFKTIESAHIHEHSVQIEIPLLQYIFTDIKIVPIITGELSIESVKEIADALLNLIDNETLILISSDFTHYGKDFNYLPFTENIKENLERLDMSAFEFIKNKDPQGFYQFYNKTKITICGRYPIMILLSMLNTDSKIELLKYTTSSELTNDFKTSVSYLSISCSGRWI